MAELPPGLEEMRAAPIFFLSSHGHYDVSKDPVPFIVPPHTYIFESAFITELTSTVMDPVLWNLIAGDVRLDFLAYFTGGENPEDPDESENLYTKDYYKRLFKSLHFYEPGDTIYVRNYTMGGGAGCRSSYESFGFYHFPISSKSEPFPISGKVGRPAAQIRALNPLRNSLIDPSIHWNKPGPPPEELILTNEEFIKTYIRGHIVSEEEPAIFIFSACGEVKCGNAKKPICDARVGIIEKHQYAQDLKATSKGLRSSIVVGSNKADKFVTKERFRSCTNSRFCLKDKELGPYEIFTYLNEDEPGLRSMPGKPVEKTPAGMYKLYQIELLDPSQPFPAILKTGDVGKMKSLEHDGNYFFSEGDIRTLVTDKKTNPSKYGPSAFYKLNKKQLILVNETMYGGRTKKQKRTKRNKSRKT